MSFILDALKKSESDRQRQNGPALFEVKVAPPRTRLPLWAVAIAALLVVNLAIVMWMMMRHPARPAAEEGAPGSVTVPAASASPAFVPPATAAATTPAPTPAAPAVTAPSVVAAQVPAAVGPAVSAAPQSATATQTAGSAAPAAALPATPRSGTSGATDESSPDDFTPAKEPAAAAGLGNHVKRGTAEGVPLYQDASATPGTQIPSLRLDLHVFAARPQERFVMINMHKAHEGDTLPEGVHVDSITPDGAILSYNGSRFLLPRD
jgi:general secretion pathway protein B